MSLKDVCVNVYQNTRGEIFALVDYTQEGETHQKLIENVECFAKTADAMLEYITDGFSGFFDYDSAQYAEKNIESVWIERVEEEEYELIAHIESNGKSAEFYAEFYFEYMTESAKSLFSEMNKIIDSEATSYPFINV